MLHNLFFEISSFKTRVMESMGGSKTGSAEIKTTGATDPKPETLRSKLKKGRRSKPERAPGSKPEKPTGSKPESVRIKTIERPDQNQRTSGSKPERGLDQNQSVPIGTRGPTKPKSPNPKGPGTTLKGAGDRPKKDWGHWDPGIRQRDWGP